MEEHKEKHAHKSEHAQKGHHKKKIKIKVDKWKIATFVFAILFVISWMTGGFSTWGDGTGDNETGTTTPVPQTGEMSLVVLNDKRCADCIKLESQVLSQLKNVFSDITITEYDYSDDEGKALYESAQKPALPAFLFSKDVQNDPGYGQVQRFIAPKGDYLSLRVGSKHDPTKEICDNGEDDTGNGKVDCEDDSCKDTLACREEIEGHLQVFIMSDCPYGREAVKALKPVLDNTEGELDYEIHYVASEKADGGFSSLHGQYEVDENIIQLCANKHSPDVWFDYLYCRSTKGVKGKDWKDCAEETGVDVDAVQTCFDDGEGEELLREDIKITKALGITGSPTWLANNRYKFGGIDSESVKTNLCKYNEDMAGCENTLSSEAGVAAGSCG